MTGKLYLKLNRQDIGFIQHDLKEDRFEITLNDPSLKLSPHLFSGADSSSVKYFLMNLLPEGVGLDKLSSMMHISKANVFGLINAIGTETTGAISFHSTPDEPEETSFREIPEQELIDRIQKRQQTPITVWDDKPRLSVAGVQEKLPVMITDESKYGLGEGDFASTHILK